MSTNQITLTKGQVILRQHGPFVSRWQVTEVIPAGARLEYVEGSVAFVGFPETYEAPNGTPLTLHPQQDFLGRAHWHAAEVIR